MSAHPLLALARTLGNPVIEGESAVFVWQGRTPPRMLDDASDWDVPRPFERLAPGLWTARLTLPLNAYVEYVFHDPQTGAPLPDPFNPKRVTNGMDSWNHYFYMPKGKPTPLADREPGAARGTLTRHAVTTGGLVTGKTRTVHLYRPPVHGPAPLLVVYDGPDYLTRARLAVIADNLIARRRVRPFAMALVQNGRQARMVEYACSDATLGFVTEGVLPLAREHLDLLPPEGGAYGVMGASMGGLMALYTAVRLPQVFGKALSQSGAFRISEQEFVLTDLVRCLPKRDIEIWMDAGRFESLLACNRAMHALLEEKGYRVFFREFSGGHNYTAWRDDVARGLETLFK
ncbi:MAG: esterase [Anaerolineaceae bacterium]|nr:MAG: esterase [Anaerolineaceae bacterium]